MKIIQSLWSAPICNHDEHISFSRSKGGWLDLKYQYMSLMLSCLTLKKYYKEVELITDTAGKNLLIDELDLPYTNVDICLDYLNNYNHGLWCLPKLHAYGMQKKPFLHVDNDVFIWGPFAKDACVTPILAQSPEINFSQYENCYNLFTHIFHHVPKILDDARSSPYKLNSINAGVMGGNDTDFFHEFSAQAFKLIDCNTKSINTYLANNSSNDIASTNIIIEQYFLYHFARFYRKDVDFLYPDLGAEYEFLLNFSKVPTYKKYIHVLGINKKKLKNCEQVEFRLRYEFPNSYFHLCKVLQLKPIGTTSPITVINNPAYKEVIRFGKAFAAINILSDKSEQIPSSNNVDSIELGISMFDGLYAKYLSELLLYERSLAQIAHHLLSYEQLRLSNVLKVYELFDWLDSEAILEQNLTTSSYVKVIKTSWDVAVFQKTLSKAEVDSLPLPREYTIALSCLQGGTDELVLDGWRKLLYNFEGNVISGRDILHAFEKDLSGDATKLSELKQVIIDFLRFELVYSGFLQLT